MASSKNVSKNGKSGCMMRGTSSVELLEPADGAVVRLMNPDWRNVLKPRLASDDPALGVYPDDLAFPCPVTLRWENTRKLRALAEVARDRNFAEIVRTCDAGCADSADVFNLETGRTYFWRVSLIDGNMTKHTSAAQVRSFQTSDADPRLIRIPGEKPVPFNVRDVGGKHRVCGGRIRQSAVYRGTEFDGEYQLTDSGRKVLREELKIRTDLDLRYPEQVAGRTQSELGSDIRRIHCPVNAYNSFTPEQNVLFRDAIRVFADSDNYPIYFHCAGGTDRTGEIAFLLEALLDAEEEELFLDYELSSLSIFPRSRDIAYFVKWRNRISSFAEPGDSWRVKAEKYMLSIGVTPDEIAAVRSNLIEPVS